MGNVCGIRVDRPLLDRWAQWIAPPLQPFFVTDPRLQEALSPLATSVETPSPEARDTFRLWRPRPRAQLFWLDEDGFARLAPPQRRRLVREQVRERRGLVSRIDDFEDLLGVAVLPAAGDGRSFVWWPSILQDAPREVLMRLVEHENDGGAHTRPPAETLRGCAPWLPGVRAVTGTFASGSGPNCFGAVMAAAGVAGAEDEWMHQEPFEEWLAARTSPVSRTLNRPGTVLVWRDAEGLAQHTAVCLDEAWALEKPSQGWMTPRWVRSLPEILRTNRTAGLRLQRHQLDPGR